MAVGVKEIFYLIRLRSHGPSNGSSILPENQCALSPIRIDLPCLQKALRPHDLYEWKLT